MSKTKPVTKFTPSNVRTILEECREALEPVAEKHGLVLDNKGRTYQRDALPVMFQLLVRQEDEDGNALKTEAKDFLKAGRMYGFEPGDLGKEFKSRGETFRITGLKPKSRKYPVLAENVKTGKSYKFPADVVKAALQRAA